MALSIGANRNLVLLLKDLENKNLTAVPFEMPYFRDELRRHMSDLFKRSLKFMELQNQRLSVLNRFKVGEIPTALEISVLKEIALDETEEKGIRKKSIRYLSLVGIDEESCLELLGSTEQGVQRISI